MPAVDLYEGGAITPPGAMIGAGLKSGDKAAGVRQLQQGRPAACRTRAWPNTPGEGRRQGRPRRDVGGGQRQPRRSPFRSSSAYLAATPPTPRRSGTQHGGITPLLPDVMPAGRQESRGELILRRHRHTDPKNRGGGQGRHDDGDPRPAALPAGLPCRCCNACCRSSTRWAASPPTTAAGTLSPKKTSTRLVPLIDRRHKVVRPLRDAPLRALLRVRKWVCVPAPPLLSSS